MLILSNFLNSFTFSSSLQPLKLGQTILIQSRFWVPHLESIVLSLGIESQNSKVSVPVSVSYLKIQKSRSQSWYRILKLKSLSFGLGTRRSFSKVSVPVSTINFWSRQSLYCTVTYSTFHPSENIFKREVSLLSLD